MFLTRHGYISSVAEIIVQDSVLQMFRHLLKKKKRYVKLVAMKDCVIFFCFSFCTMLLPAWQNRECSVKMIAFALLSLEPHKTARESCQTRKKIKTKAKCERVYFYYACHCSQYQPGTQNKSREAHLQNNKVTYNGNSNCKMYSM
jgi:hypothetical protein